MSTRTVKLKTEDVERSIYDELAARLAKDEIPIHRPGERWDGRSEVWMEPRIQSFDRQGSRSRNGSECHSVRWAFTLYRKVGPKAKRFGSLSALVDVVRLVVDYSAGAVAMRVRDERQRVIALAEWGEAQEDRAHDQAVTIDGVTHQGFDVATLTVVAILSAA